MSESLCYSIPEPEDTASVTITFVVLIVSTGLLFLQEIKKINKLIVAKAKCKFLINVLVYFFDCRNYFLKGCDKCKIF